MGDEKIRIMHVCDKWGVGGSSIHGVSQALSRWIVRLDSKRFETRLIGLRGGGKAQKELERDGLDVTNIGRGKFDPFTLPDLLQHINSWQPTILHLHGYASADFGLVAGRFTGTKTIVHEHFVDPQIPSYQVACDYLLSRLSTLNIACSHAVKDFMVDRRFFQEEDTKVIYYGAPLDEFEPSSPKMARQERDRWGIPHSSTVVGTVGRLDKQKGLRYLIEAAPSILENYPDVTFVLVGDGPLQDDLEERAVELGVIENFVFTGYHREPQKIQTVFDVQVFPSLWEGIPLTVVEAMAMGLPIVSTNVDGIKEALRDEENALIVDERDSQQLAEAIDRLLSNPSLANRLAKQAKVDSENYDVDHTTHQLAETYLEVANS